MARLALDNPANYINRESSWLEFNRRVLEEAQDHKNPLLERLKFLSISASNLDEFFEVRVAGLVQQIEDGYTEAGPDGLTLLEERDVVSRDTHEFVDDQYHCWNQELRPALADHGIRVLGLHELDSRARAFIEEYCEKELDLLLKQVTVDPAHPFPRVINKALCVAFLLRRRRRSALTYTGVVTVPRALPRLVRLPSDGTDDFSCLADLVAFHAARLRQHRGNLLAQQRHAAGTAGEEHGVDIVRVDCSIFEQPHHGTRHRADQLADGRVEVGPVQGERFARGDAPGPPYPRSGRWLSLTAAHALPAATPTRGCGAGVGD